MPVRLDHLLLDAATTARDVEALITTVLAEPSTHRGVVVPPVFARRVVDALRGSGVRVASVVGYPLGFSKATIKAIEATSLAKDGVDAVEVTPLLTNVVDGNFDALRDELLEIVRGVRAARPTTTIHVRLELDRLVTRLVPAAFGSIADAITRGACDGVVLESSADEAITTALEAFAGTRLERKSITPSGLAHGADATGRPWQTPR